MQSKTNDINNIDIDFMLYLAHREQVLKIVDVMRKEFSNRKLSYLINVDRTTLGIMIKTKKYSKKTKQSIIDSIYRIAWERDLDVANKYDEETREQLVKLRQEVFGKDVLSKKELLNRGELAEKYNTFEIIMVAVLGSICLGLIIVGILGAIQL
jgi:predicted nuclease of restriction endonuclease-like RecB superfamily